MLGSLNKDSGPTNTRVKEDCIYNNHGCALEILTVQFQTTTIKQVSQHSHTNLRGRINVIFTLLYC